MKTCYTCKWWGDQCGEIPTYHKCEKNQGGYDGPPDGARVVDGEPYSAGDIGTGPQFGCIHHETK